MLNPALDALNIGIPHKVKLGRPYLLRINAKGRGLPSDGHWLNITVAGKTTVPRTIKKIADNTWEAELEPLPKTGDYNVKACAWVNKRKTESEEDLTIRLSAAAAELWEQGDYSAALIKNPDQEDWLNALEHKTRKKRDFQHDYLGILDAVRKKHPDHTDINRRYWRLRHGKLTDVKKAPVIRWPLAILLIIDLLAATSGIFYLMGARFNGEDMIISLKNENTALKKANPPNKDNIDLLQETQKANKREISALQQKFEENNARSVSLLKQIKTQKEQLAVLGQDKSQKDDQMAVLLKETQTLQTANEKLQKEIKELQDSEKQKADQIAALLKTAAKYRKNNKLTTPPGANAYENYLTALKIDPGNDKALEGIQKIADSYKALALKAFKSKKYEQADKYIKKGLEVAPEHKELQALNQKPHVRLRSRPATLSVDDVKAMLK